jgi:hypothetical protein
MNTRNYTNAISRTMISFETLKNYALDALLIFLLYYVVDTRTISISLSFDRPELIQDYSVAVSSKTDIVPLRGDL